MEAEETRLADEEYSDREIEKYLDEDAMNTKLLKGVTHASVVMTPKSLSGKTEVLGVIFLHFGPDEANAIGQIHLMKGDNRIVWRLPYVEQVVNEQVKRYPVFKGKVADEINEWAETAYNLIKKTFGKAQFGHRYRIANGKAFDETLTEVNAGA